MASKYWVGGSSTWDATAGTKWSGSSGGAGGAAVPSSLDTAFFDAASGAVTVTISVSRTVGVLDCTGFTGTLAGPGPLNLVHSSATTQIKISSTHTYTVANTNFANTSGSAEFYSSNATVQGNINKTGSTGGLTMGYAGNLTCTGDFTVDFGTSGTVTFGQGRAFTFRDMFCSAAAGFYSLYNMGSITLTGTTCYFQAGATFDQNNAGGTPTIIMNNVATNKYFDGAGTNLGPIVLVWLVVGPSAITTLQNSNTMRLKVTAPAGGGILRLQSGKTTTLRSWDVTGSAGNLITIDSDSPGTQGLFSSTADVTSDYISLKDNGASGGGVFTPGTNSTILTNVTGWTLPSTAQPLAIIMA